MNKFHVIKKLLFTNSLCKIVRSSVILLLPLFYLVILPVKSILSDDIPQAFLLFRFVDIIVITVHDRLWNVGQANCILKYFENMMIDHSDSTIFF